MERFELVSYDDLSAKISQVLQIAGMTLKDADITADVLADADAKGIESHGAIRTKQYVSRIMAGGIEACSVVRCLSDENRCVLQFDGGNGLGQPAMQQILQTGMKRAKELGICAFGLSHVNHFGTAGYYTELAAKNGLIMILCCNVLPLSAPWGGIDPRLGTNPISISFPARDYPIVLDMATTAIAVGKLAVYQEKNQLLPPGVAMTADGKPTLIPEEAMKGILLHAGGYKGYGLSVAIDLLCSAVAGGCASYEMTKEELFQKTDKRIGVFGILIDISQFSPMDTYLDKVENIRKAMRSSRLAEGFERIYLPGEIEHENAVEAKKHGIRLLKSTWNFMEDWIAQNQQ